MCGMRWSNLVSMLAAATTTYRWIPITDWFVVADGASVCAAINSVVLPSGLGAYLAVEYATVRTDDPDNSVTHLGSQITTETKTPILTTLSASNKMYPRLVIDYGRTSSGSELAGQLVIQTLAVHQCAHLLGSRQESLANVLSQASGGALDNAIIWPVGPFIPTVGSPKFKGTIIGRNMLNYGSVETIMVYRTATDPNNPDAWALLESSTWDTPSGSNDERNTGEQTPTVTDKALVQAGFAVRRAAAGSAIRGDFDMSILLILS